MTVVNFAITKPLEQQVNQAIRKFGFMSKAEFFRSAVLNFLQSLQAHGAHSDFNVDQEYSKSVKELSKLLEKKFKNKEMPSLEEQFADLM